MPTTVDLQTSLTILLVTAGYLELSEDTLRAWVYGRLCPSEEAGF